MQTVETRNLRWSALDWAVAEAIGKEGVYVCPNSPHKTLFIDDAEVTFGRYIWRPTESWGQIGPLLEMLGAVEIIPIEALGFIIGDHAPCGPTPEWVIEGNTMPIAICRAVVRKVIGESVEIPDNLTPTEVYASNESTIDAEGAKWT